MASEFQLFFSFGCVWQLPSWWDVAHLTRLMMTGKLMEIQVRFLLFIYSTQPTYSKNFPSSFNPNDSHIFSLCRYHESTSNHKRYDLFRNYTEYLSLRYSMSQSSNLTRTFFSDLDPCDDFQCLNGGTCRVSPIGQDNSGDDDDMNVSGALSCICPPKFVGDRCERSNTFLRQ